MKEMNAFKILVNDVVNTYGGTSYMDNDGEDDYSPWFTCPGCDEPIYYEDWDIDMLTNTNGEFICPICGEIFEL